jgi:hypothetical protein
VNAALLLKDGDEKLIKDVPFHAGDSAPSFDCDDDEELT